MFRSFSSRISAIIFSCLGLAWLTCGNKSKPADAEITPTGTLLYEVSGNGLSKPSYVFGTIHIISEKDFFMPEAIDSCMSNTTKLVMEINLKDILGQMKVLELLKLPEGKTLEDLYSKKEYKFIKKVLADSLDTDIEIYKTIKPIFLQQQILINSFISGTPKSYELEFLQMASAKGLNTGGLETADEQMKILDSMSLESQAAILLKSMKDLHREKKKLGEMIEVYKLQEVDSLYVMTSQDEDLKGIDESLLNNRNKKWIPLIENEMKAQPTFFAVGAAHLGGPEGVLKLLEQKGYTVTPVK